ncbi:uncharacterized protein PHALS_14667 [Plasmopara halstedii]|uniref:Uncharacterized protein n=1 Tax=Plasmopara halstedii TaxID=4781 RepID=A0A0P1AN58_PLAHL|nr:uncharacterized protein PHALS_14667 [Plasmopara halstedii]CEG42836.1 hypothetical protein PHALS_14667 [Plasmopara halstedii]|eukprot:XP_024579205.1 hypothetical protein PHALS_14667 [Plasmopara halstedii]
MSAITQNYSKVEAFANVIDHISTAYYHLVLTFVACMYLTYHAAMHNIFLILNFIPGSIMTN